MGQVGEVLDDLVEAHGVGQSDTVFLTVDSALLESGVQLRESHGSRGSTEAVDDRHVDVVLLGADLQADHISGGLDLVLGVGEHTQAVIAPAEELPAALFFGLLTEHLAELTVIDLPADLTIVDQVRHVGNINGVAEASDHAGGDDAAVDGAKGDALEDLTLGAELGSGIVLDLQTAIGSLFELSRHLLSRESETVVGGGGVCPGNGVDGTVIRRIAAVVAVAGVLAAAAEEGENSDQAKQKGKNTRSLFHK